MTMPQVLYSRYEDGAKRVLIGVQGEWEIAGAVPLRGKTTKGLLAALTGHPGGRHWSLDRYFRMGAYAAPEPKQAITLDLDLWALPVPVVVSVAVSTTSGITVPAGIGIDLAKRGHEVRKLFFAGFGRQVFMMGYDPEDVLQEVYKGLLIRNAGTCPFDPTKASFGHYVHMVASCVFSNYRRKQRRIHEVEQVGLPSRGQVKDVAANTTVAARLTTVASDSLVLEAADDLLGHLGLATGQPEAHLAAQLVPLMLRGTPRDQLADLLGVSPAAVTRALTHLRRQARDWHAMSL